MGAKRGGWLRRSHSLQHKALDGLGDAAVVVRTFGSELTNKGANAAAAASAAVSQSPAKAASAARTMSVRERAAAIERAAA